MTHIRQHPSAPLTEIDKLLRCPLSNVGIIETLLEKVSLDISNKI
jgi:hypothetical protein